MSVRRPLVRRSRARALAWLLPAVLAGAAAGCRRTPPPPPPPPLPALGQVTVVDMAPERSGPRLDTDVLAAEIRRQLAGSGLVATSPLDAGVAGVGGGGSADAAAQHAMSPGRARPVLSVRAEVAAETLEVDQKGLVRAAVRVKLATRPELSAGAIAEDLNAGAERPYEVRPGLNRASLRQQVAASATADLMRAFIARKRLATASPDALREALGADGGGLREEAIRQIGARALKDHGPALLPLLHDPDEAVRDAALGALLALGDRRAVPELTRSRSLRDRREMGKILEAIATLGGDEARDYLSFVAESHDDEGIRALAADARRRLEQRADAGHRERK
jgi:hypothetical protein